MQGDNNLTPCISYTGSISYSYGAAVLSWGTFTGQVNSPTGQSYDISGNINGVGFQAGYFSGTVPVSFTASSPQSIGSNGVFFTASVGASDGPVNIASVDQNVFVNGTSGSPSAELPEFTLLNLSTDTSPASPQDILKTEANIGVSFSVQGVTVTTVTRHYSGASGSW